MTASELRDRLTDLIDQAKEEGWDGSDAEVYVDWRKLIAHFGGIEGAAPEVPINMADLQIDNDGPTILIQ